MWVDYTIDLWKKIENTRVDRDDLTLWESFQFMYGMETLNEGKKGRHSSVGGE